MVPEPEMVVKDIMTRTRAHSLGCVPKCIMRRPNSFRALAVGVANTSTEVARKLFVAFGLGVAFLVELRDQREQSDASAGFDFFWPVVSNAVGEVDEPLASDVVTEYD